MNPMTLIRRHPLIAYFVLAYALTWWIYPLLHFSPLIGLVGLFGPAFAAIIMAAITDGKPGVKALLSRTVRWRVGLPWYVVALGLPTLLSLATAGLSVVLGTGVLQFGQLTVLDFVVFVLVVGEELGWRGYALPKLLETRSALTASVILGVVWGLWHLPTFFSSSAPQQGLPIVAFVLMTIEYSIIMSWIYLHTRGSVLIATLCHGAINLSQGFFLGGITGSMRYWLHRRRLRGRRHRRRLRPAVTGEGAGHPVGERRLTRTDSGWPDGGSSVGGSAGDPIAHLTSEVLQVAGVLEPLQHDPVVDAYVLVHQDVAEAGRLTHALRERGLEDTVAAEDREGVAVVERRPPTLRGAQVLGDVDGALDGGHERVLDPPQPQRVGAPVQVRRGFRLQDGQVIRDRSEEAQDAGLIDHVGGSLRTRDDCALSAGARRSRSFGFARPS